MKYKKIGIIGSGTVGQSLANGLLKSGYEVRIGTRDVNKMHEWLNKAGKKASVGSFSEAASFGELIFLCTKWDGTKNAIDMAEKKNFKDKIVVDVTNPLKSEKDKSPTLALGYPESGGSSVQKWLPDSKVVKSFNIVTAAYMTNPKLKEGKPDMFIAGNDNNAKKSVSEIASSWGWNVIDMGDIKQSYLLEALAMTWIRYGFLNSHWTHAFKLLKS